MYMKGIYIVLSILHEVRLMHTCTCIYILQIKFTFRLDLSHSTWVISFYLQLVFSLFMYIIIFKWVTFAILILITF